MAGIHVPRPCVAVLAAVALAAGCGQATGGSAGGRQADTKPRQTAVQGERGIAQRAVGGTASSSCVARVEYAGHTYTGYGELMRDPAVTGRVETATMPGCGDGDEAAQDERVQVEELAELPMDRAVLGSGRLYIRADLPFPEAVRRWFTPPRCETAGEFELRGDWLAVNTPRRPRFDGDLRPPYRVSVHVVEGPSDYVGATIDVRATGSTDPTLGPEDVKTSLWKGGGLIASARCVDGAFVASALTSTPG